MKKKADFKQAKIATRLMAVQSLYSQDVTTGTLAATLTHDPDQLVETVIQVLGADNVLDEKTIASIDRVLLHQLINGVLSHQTELDEKLKPYLKKSSGVDKLSMVLRSVLRAAVYEMLYSKDVKATSIIDSYVEVTKAFYEAKEAGFVNGLLDALAKDIR